MRYYLKPINDYKINKVVRLNKDNNKIYIYYIIRKFQYFNNITQTKETVDVSSPTKEGLLEKCKKLRSVEFKLEPIIKSNVSVSEVCDEWLKQDRKLIVQEESVEVYSSRIENYFKVYFKGEAFGELRKKDILEFIKWIKDKKIAFYTMRLIVGTFKMICDYALKNHYTRIDLFKGVVLPKFSIIASIKPLTYEEQNIFYNNIKDDPYGDFFMVLLLAGMRVRELLGATMQNYDESHNNLFIDRQLSRKKNANNYFFHKMRTKNSQNYYCNLIPDASDIIKRRIAINKARSSEASYNNYLNLIFTDEFGNPLKYQRLLGYFKDVVKKIGRDDCTIHCLRKTFACNLYTATKDLETVRKALNHLNLATTEKYLGPMAIPNQVQFIFYDELIEKIKEGKYDEISRNMNEVYIDEIAA